MDGFEQSRGPQVPLRKGEPNASDDVLSSAFTYSPLPASCSTRLLELQPAPSPSDALRGVLVDMTFPASEPYDALSYTWGPPIFSDILFLSSHVSAPNNHSIAYVTSSLSEALRRFRLTDSVKRIWVDAVCINQANDDEKSLQIPRMKDVYTSASHVLVWLGDDEEGMKTIMQLKSMWSRSQESDAHLTKSETAEAMLLLTSLFALPWFSRMWIIQEVVLNQNVILHCASAVLPWQALKEVAEHILFEGGRVESKSFKAFRGMMNLWVSLAVGIERASPSEGDGCHGFGSSGRQDLAAAFKCPYYPRKAINLESTSLLTLMGRFSHFGCSDGRDRIFALVGLANDVIASRDPNHSRDDVPQESEWPKRMILNSDYTSNLEEVYTSTAKVVVESGRLLWLFSQAAVRDGSTMLNLPSWVPDWRQPVIRYSIWRDIRYVQVHSILLVRIRNSHLIRMEMQPEMQTFHGSLSNIHITNFSVDWRSENFPSRSNGQHVDFEVFEHGPSSLTEMTRRWIKKSFDELLVSLSGWVTQATDCQLLWNQAVAQVAYCICADGTFFTDQFLDQEVQWHIHSFGSGIREDKDWYDLISPAAREVLSKLDALPETYALTHILEGVLPDEPQYRFPGALGTIHPQAYYFEQMHAVEIVMHERCLFACRLLPAFDLFSESIHGHLIGTGPSDTDPGDVILAPCCDERQLGPWRWTYLLREQQEGPQIEKDDIGPAYKLIGECFMLKPSHSYLFKTGSEYEVRKENRLTGVCTEDPLVHQESCAKKRRIKCCEVHSRTKWEFDHERQKFTYHLNLL